VLTIKLRGVILLDQLDSD